MAGDLPFRHPAFRDGLTRADLVDWYRQMRARTRALFALLEPEAYYERPIPLRHPFVFYDGHLPAFAVNTLVKLGLGHRGIDERLEVLFARGIDPESEAAVRNPAELWPDRGNVEAYANAADALIEETLASADLEAGRAPAMRDGEAIFTVLEHEAMHQETLLYMLHNLAYERKRRPPQIATPRPEGPARRRWIGIPAGSAVLGREKDGVFGWDNEFGREVRSVPEFEIESHKVTNGDYLEFVEAGAAPPHFWLKDDGGGWLWRGMFGPAPLLLDTPVFVTHDQATSYARWRGQRLPDEGQYHRAAFGSPSGEDRSFPWGEEPPDRSNGNFDFAHWDPLPGGLYPRGVSAWGVEDLVGNGWEWTASAFGPFAGFEPMPSYPPYSTDFFDGDHFVLKGASPATDRRLIRRTFRNWFRPGYPYVFAAFRCVRPGAPGRQR